MNKADIIKVLGGVGLGGLVGYFARDLVQPQLPGVFANAVKRLKCVDTKLNFTLEGPQIYGGSAEPNGWEYYLVGFGLPSGHLKDDILISLARQGTSTNINANCVKLADDQVDVYLDNVLQVTLPDHGGATPKTLYNAFACFPI
jgi:hypothetical protein